MRQRFFAAFLTFLLAGCGVMGGDYPGPRYRVVEAQGTIEIRDYAPMAIAEVTRDGERSSAANAGFRPLADFIFGANRQAQKIGMTAPVLMEPQTINLPMTAPVMAQAAALDDNKKWRIQFVMPEGMGRAQLPIPDNAEIALLDVPARRMAAIRFSGFGSDANLEQHRALLAAFLTERGLAPSGPAIFAFYNPPWTLPFLRRNEVLYPLPLPE